MGWWSKKEGKCEVNVVPRFSSLARQHGILKELKYLGRVL